MNDFADEHSNLISSCCENMMQIERAIFVSASDMPKKQRDLLSSFSIAMLYSIWEGFVSKSFKIYIEYLNSQKLAHKEYIDSLLVYNMELHFKQFQKYPEKQEKKERFFRDLYSFCCNQDSTIKNFVKTESNVNLKVLNNLMSTFGLLEFPEFWNSYQYPKPSLKNKLDEFLMYRNAVAHGSDVTGEGIITQDVYNEYRNLLRELMYAMHEEFLRGIEEATYIKSNVRD